MSGTANPTHEVHRGDVPYQAPFTRSTSPNDSLTTAYGADETSLSDAELSEDAFSNKVLAGLRIHEKREEEERAEARPLIMPRARRGATTTVSAQTEEKGGTIRCDNTSDKLNLYMKRCLIRSCVRCGGTSKSSRKKIRWRVCCSVG
jgi:IS5 family transposase